MIHWYVHLSWSQAALIVIAVLLVLAALASILGKCLAINEELPEPRSYPLADYSAQYREKVEWLGENFLLAKPINRRVTR